MNGSINRSILCYLSQPSLCVPATALPPIPSSSEATAITLLPSAMLLSTTVTTNKQLLLLLLLQLQRTMSPGYLRPAPTRTAPSNTPSPRTMMHTTTTMTMPLRTTCELTQRHVADHWAVLCISVSYCSQLFGLISTPGQPPHSLSSVLNHVPLSLPWMFSLIK